MMTKRYLENLVQACSDQSFGQDAVEWAVLQGHFIPTFNLEADLKAIHSPLTLHGNEKPATRYDEIVEAYQAVVRSQHTQLLDSYEPLLAAIRNPNHHPEEIHAH